MLSVRADYVLSSLQVGRDTSRYTPGPAGRAQARTSPSNCFDAKGLLLIRSLLAAIFVESFDTDEQLTVPSRDDKIGMLDHPLKTTDVINRASFAKS